MYLNAVLSNFGAWHRLIDQYPEHFADIAQVITALEVKNFTADLRNRGLNGLRGSKDGIDIRELHLSASNDFVIRGWSPFSVELHPTSIIAGLDARITIKEVELRKDRIGLDIFFGKIQFLESKIFSELPFFVRSNILEIMVFIVPMKSLAIKSLSHTKGFEAIANRLTLLESTSIPYSFIIIGISDQNSETQIIELTSPIDNFLMPRVGLSLNEMVIRNEMSNYDFKIILPSNEKIAKEICAMANSKGGGILLIGVDKFGDVQGIEKGKVLDDSMLKVTNIIQTTLSPKPNYQFHVFDIPNDPFKCLLIIDVLEIEHKPCMTGERVYIRGGTSTIAAGPDEIRRLIVG